MRSLIIVLLGICCLIEAYLPGVAPKDYATADLIQLKVNKLDSVKTQTPYEYYDLNFCHGEVQKDSENLGEVLAGDAIESSPYEIQMRVDEYCKILCKRTNNAKQLRHFAQMINDEYAVDWVVDNLPAATKYYDLDSNIRYEKGFPLGFVGSMMHHATVDGLAYLNNHIRIRLDYHKQQGSPDDCTRCYRVVGFEVEVFSINHELDNKDQLTTCTKEVPFLRSQKPQAVSGSEVKGGTDIIYTYDVEWQQSDVQWASRWDIYLAMTDVDIHWFSIINSILVTCFLSLAVAVILVRTLRADLLRYNEEDEDPDEILIERQEETGWKLVHGDVFRPPRFGSLFATLIGTGVQVALMTSITLVFACLGLLSPANRGGLMTTFLLLFVFMGFWGGYVSTQTYKRFKLAHWKANTLMTAVLFPGLSFMVFFVLNLFLWYEGSSGAVPFTTLLSLLILWLGISVPLVYLGSYYAMRQPTPDNPVRTVTIPRELPLEQPIWTTFWVQVIGSGILPFLAVFVESFFIMNSVWQHQFYYMFSFVAVVLMILAINTAEMAVVMCYYQLCYEDYRWWWRSLFNSGSVSFFMFINAVRYYHESEITGFVPSLLYFGYTWLICAFFFVMMGAIGHLVCLWFVRTIYGSLKVD